MKSAPVLLDTSALLALLEDEPGADAVEGHLEDAEAGRTEVFASFASLTEVYYVTHQEQGVQKAEEFTAIVQGWPVAFVFPDEAMAIAAGKLKARHSISFADAFVAASAQQLGAALVHKDPEYESLAGLVTLAPLPYKPRTSKKP